MPMPVRRGRSTLDPRTRSDGAREMQGLPKPAVEPDARLGSVSIRTIRQGDLPAILAIERASFDSPWSIAMFISELSRLESICLAAIAGDQPIGYLVCGRYERIWHLNNIAVRAGRRRQGLGTRLLEAMLDRVGPEAEVTLEVRPSNRAAIAMYEEHGFRLAGRRPGYYPDNREDALIMTRAGERGHPGRADDDPT